MAAPALLSDCTQADTASSDTPCVVCIAHIVEQHGLNTLIQTYKLSGLLSNNTTTTFMSKQL